jgi:hypothetical protein
MSMYLELDGKLAGKIEHVGSNANVSRIKGAFDVVTKTVIDDLTFNCGAGLSAAFYEWLSSGVDGRPVRKAVSVYGVDMGGPENPPLEFQNAMVTRVDFPPLSAASRDSAFLSVRVRAEGAQSVPPGAKPVPRNATWTKPRAILKRWCAADYRLSIPGINTKWITSIRGMSAGLRMAELPVDSTGGYQIEPTGRNTPNLEITMSENGNEDFMAWYKRMVIDGMLDEKSATLEYQSPGGKFTYFRLELSELGLYKMEPVTDGPIRQMRMKMYCTGITFKAEPAACVG